MANITKKMAAIRTVFPIGFSEYNMQSLNDQLETLASANHPTLIKVMLMVAREL